ncbi:MAG: hypothetical protein R3B09_21910 [Nannocystaceae bacterium]
MKPIQICQSLGAERLNAYYAELSGKELRDVLRAGGASVNVPQTAYTQAARRNAWRKRFDSELNGGNQPLAMALLLEWLMRHHRSMLVDYLDFLEVKHTMGETDEDFLKTRDEERLRAGVEHLLAKYPAHEVATYMLLVGHIQESTVFDRTASVLTAIGLDDAAAAAHVADYEAREARSGAAASAS